MKKVCFIINNISKHGGVQKILSVVANNLSKQNFLDVSILFTSPEKIARQNVYKLSNNLTIYYTDKLQSSIEKESLNMFFDKFNRRIFHFKNSNLLERIYFPKKEIEHYNNFFNENKFDHIIGVTPRYAGIVALLDVNSKKTGWLHSTYERYFNLKGLEYWNQIELYNRLFCMLDNVVVLTDSSKKKFDKEMEIESTRIYNPLTVDISDSYSIENDELLFLGRIYYKTKGIDLLLEIMKEIIALEPKIILNIVGDGPDFERMINDISEFNLENNIRIHGESDNVSEHYSKNSLLLLPSRMEGFGLVATEAMAHGLPVVSFQTEGPSEIIEHEKSGILIPKYDVKKFAEIVVYLLKNPTKRTHLSKGALERSTNFSQEQIIEEWIEILD